LCVSAALVGCNDPDPDAGTDAATQVTPGATATPESPTPTAEPTPSAEPTEVANPKLLAKPSDIPVGGGVVFAAKNVVVTQPQEGVFKGFSATCTHQGAIVNLVSDGAIHCPRHGSAFSIKDGSVVNGPATAPLPKQDLDVARNTISLP
jgi:Rieske Fe-S protein